MTAEGHREVRLFHKSRLTEITVVPTVHFLRPNFSNPDDVTVYLSRFEIIVGEADLRIQGEEQVFSRCPLTFQDAARFNSKVAVDIFRKRQGALLELEVLRRITEGRPGYFGLVSLGSFSNLMNSLDCKLQESFVEQVRSNFISGLADEYFLEFLRRFDDSSVDLTISDTRKLSGLLNCPCAESIESEVLMKRNRQFVTKLEKILEGKPRNVLLLVGAAHTVGPNSVIELLRRLGYGLAQGSAR